MFISNDALGQYLNILFILVWIYSSSFLTVFSEFKEKIFNRGTIIMSCYLLIEAEHKSASHNRTKASTERRRYRAQVGTAMFPNGCPKGRTIVVFLVGKKIQRPALLEVNQRYFAGISEVKWHNGGRGHRQAVLSDSGASALHPARTKGLAPGRTGKLWVRILANALKDKFPYGKLEIKALVTQQRKPLIK